MLIIAISATVYIILKPEPDKNFTEFYLLGPNGTASNYPNNLTIGQSGNVIIGIVNHEHKTVNYNLVVTSNDTVIKEQNITLTNEKKIEIPFTFTQSSLGKKKIEFRLYKMPDNTTIYNSVYIYVNVI